MRTNGAFTLIELLVVVAIISVLVAILVPVVTSGVSDTHEAVCKTNLKTIGGAFRDYKNDVKHPDFPRMDTKGEPNDVLGESNDLKTADAQGILKYNTAELNTNTMQNMWLLIDAGFLPPQAFKCPADGDYENRTSNTRYGWTAWTQFSYGMQNPYAQSTTGTENPVDPSSKSYKAHWVFMTDMSPGAPVDGINVLHTNHTDGFNYMTRVGNVAFHSVTEGDKRSVVFGEEVFADDSKTDEWPDRDQAANAVQDDVVITPTNAVAQRLAGAGVGQPEE